jgi:hypothetical protein
MPELWPHVSPSHDDRPGGPDPIVLLVPDSTDGIVNKGPVSFSAANIAVWLLGQSKLCSNGLAYQRFPRLLMGPAPYR